MGTETNIESSQRPDLPGNTEKLFVSAKRSAFLGIIAFLILAFLVGAIIQQRYINRKQDKKEEALAVANNARVRLQESLAFSLSAAKTLSFFVQHDGTVTNFDSTASQILQAVNDIDALQLVPGGVIQYVFPLKGNENVIGYDILKDPLRNKEAFKAIEKKEMFFAGPFELRQGGMGVVGRLPIYRNDKFWGFSAVVIKMNTLLKSAGIDSTGNSGYYYQLSKINPDSKEEEFFITHGKKHSKLHTISVYVPNGEWRLSVIPVKPLGGFENIFILAGLGFLFCVLGAVLIYSVSRRPKKLDELVRVRTTQLKESEENYKNLFERSPLPLWIYDLETFKFLEVNDAAIKLYGYSREEFLEMDVLAIRREEHIPKFLETARNNTDELRHTGVWEHIKKNKEQIQVLIFSRNISYNGKQGRLVLVMDVSEKVKIENELVKSEEKYRSLIEQASDGIILYSFDGSIHSFNKAAHLQAGYTREEFEKLNLKDLFLEKGVLKNKSKEGRIHSDQPTTLYRKLKKKDGSIFSVELNARMLPDGKIFAIVRDITEREKTAAALQESEEKFSKAFHSNVLGFAIYNDEYRAVDMNETFAMMLESTREQLLGKTSEEAGLINKVNEKSRNAVREKIQEKIQAEGHLQNFEVEIETHNQRLVTLLLSLEPLELNNKTHWITSAIDITDRKRNEDILRYQARLLESVSDAITSLDMNRNIVSWNQACEELYGFTAEEVMGKRIPELVVFEFPGSTNDEVFKQVFTDGQWKGEFNFIHPKTTIKTYLLSSINILKNNDGSISGFIITSRDITDRKKAEEEINKSNERFEVIAQATNDAVWDHDLNTNITWGNKKLYDLYGFDPAKQTINFEMFLEHIHPDERDGIAGRMKEAIKQSINSLSEEFRFKIANGEYRNFHDRAYIKYDEKGNALKILGAMQDITDREIIKKQILKEKELSDSIINSLPGIFYLYNKAGKFLRWNRNFETVTGYSSEEIEHMHPLDLFDKEDQPLLKAKIENVFVAGEDHVEADLLLKNKQKILYYFTGQAIEFEGETCLMGVGLDFSEKEKAARIIRESEEKYRTIIEQASDGIFIADENEHFIDVNSAGCRMLGYTKKELYKLKFSSLIPAEDVETNAVRFSELKAGKTVINERRLTKKDGSIIDVEISAKVLFDGRYQSIVRDITERKKAAEEIRANSELLRDLYSYLQDIREEERTHIAREIHDELGQQLTGLKMDLSWINRKLQGTDKLINEKLSGTISLVDATIQTVRKIATELRPSILDDLGLVAALEWQSEEFGKRSDIKVKFTSNLNETLVQPDIATSLFRIYQELLTNVARHAQAEAVNTSIYISNNQLHLSVEDNGIGFDIDSIMAKKTLGLRGIKERTNLIGGKYEIKSKPGEGTFVLISVPL